MLSPLETISPSPVGEKLNSLEASGAAAGGLGFGNLPSGGLGPVPAVQGASPPSPPPSAEAGHPGGYIPELEAEKELESRITIAPFMENLIIEEKFSDVIDLRPATLQLQLEKSRNTLNQITKKEAEVQKVLGEMKQVGEEFDSLYEYKKAKLEYMLDVVLKERKTLEEERQKFLEEQVMVKNWGKVKDESDFINPEPDDLTTPTNEKIVYVMTDLPEPEKQIIYKEAEPNYWPVVAGIGIALIGGIILGWLLSRKR